MGAAALFAAQLMSFGASVALMKKAMPDGIVKQSNRLLVTYVMSSVYLMYARTTSILIYHAYEHGTSNFHENTGTNTANQPCI